MRSYYPVAIQLLYRQLEFLLFFFHIYISRLRVYVYPYSPENLSSLVRTHMLPYVFSPRKSRAYRFPREIFCYFLNGYHKIDCKSTNNSIINIIIYTNVIGMHITLPLTRDYRKSKWVLLYHVPCNRLSQILNFFGY